MTKDELAEVYLRGAGYYRKLAYRYLRGFPNADELTRDVVQDAFLEAYRKIDNYDPTRSSPFTWVRHFVTWEARHCRARIMADERRLVPITETTQANLPVVGETETSAFLERLLAALPLPQRTAVTRVVLDGQGYTEVAKELGISKQAVHQAVQRGLARLQKILKRQGERLPVDLYVKTSHVGDEPTT